MYLKVLLTRLKVAVCTLKKSIAKLVTFSGRVLHLQHGGRVSSSSDAQGLEETKVPLRQRANSHVDPLCGADHRRMASCSRTGVVSMSQFQFAFSKLSAWLIQGQLHRTMSLDLCISEGYVRGGFKASLLRPGLSKSPSLVKIR